MPLCVCVCLECAVVSPELIAVKLAVWSMFLLMVLRWSWRNLYLLKTKFPQFTVMVLQSSRFLILFDFTVILLYRLKLIFRRHELRVLLVWTVYFDVVKAEYIM